MDESQLRTIAQLQDFLKATPQVSFSGLDTKDGDERYAQISRVLKRFDYPRRTKTERGVVLAYASIAPTVSGKANGLQPIATLIDVGHITLNRTLRQLRRTFQAIIAGCIPQ